MVSKWGQGHRRAATEACEGRNGQTQTDRQTVRQMQNWLDGGRDYRQRQIANRGRWREMTDR